MNNQPVQPISPKRITLESGVYQGVVSHKRFSPKFHSFSYKVSMIGLVLDELDDIKNQNILLGTQWFNPVRFYEKDYLKNEPGTLKQRITNKVKQLGGDWDGTKVLMIAQCRCLGIYFSPINFYYCFDKSNTCCLMLAEVSNTPWNQRYYYLVNMEPKTQESVKITKKAFHVSPFMALDMNYHWHVTTPGNKANVNIKNYDLSNKHKIFEANMILEKQLLSSLPIIKSWVSLPFTVIKIVTLIYWQAAKIFIKRIPFVNYQKH